MTLATSLSMAAATVACVVSGRRWILASALEDCAPGALRRIYAKWAFPPAPAANAVAHRHGMAGRLMMLPFKQASQIGERRIGGQRGLASGNVVELHAPISLSVVAGIFGILAIVSRAVPVLFVIGVAYAVVFPYGMKIDRRQILPSTNAWIAPLTALSAVVGAGTAAIAWIALGHGLVVLTCAIVLIPVDVSIAIRMLLPLRRKFLARALAKRVGESAVRGVIVLASSGRAVLVESIARHLEIAREVSSGSVSGVWTAAAVAMDSASAAIVVGVSPDQGQELAVVVPAGTVAAVIVGHVDQGEWEHLHTALRRLVDSRALQGPVVALNAPGIDAGLRAEIEALGVRWVSVGPGAAHEVAVAVEGGHWEIQGRGRLQETLEPIDGWTPEEVGIVAATVIEWGGGFEARGRVVRPELLVGRWSVRTSSSGVTVMVASDDVDRRALVSALTTFDALKVDGSKFVVTSGLSGTDGVTRATNYELGARVGQLGAELIVVGREGLQSLCNGIGHDARRFDRFDDAVAWAAATLRTGDAVLYLGHRKSNVP